MIACVTPVSINNHVEYIQMIGNRFLRYTLPGSTDEEIDVGQDLLWSHEPKEREEELKALASQVSDYIANLPTLDVDDSVAADAINTLALLASRGRSNVLQPEEPYRATLQLRMLARALARIHQRSKVTEHDRRLLTKVVLSNIPVPRLDALFVLRDESLTISELGRQGIHHDVVYDLVKLGLLDYSEGKYSVKGRFRPYVEPLGETVHSDMPELELCGGPTVAAKPTAL
jgi:MoxR-like ATPase